MFEEEEKILVPPATKKFKTFSQREPDGPINRGLFEKDLPVMMYGYGDVAEPLQGTVNLVEDLMLEYISTLVENALDISCYRGKIKHEDFLYQMKEVSKYKRIQELLEKNEDIKRVRRMDFDNLDEYDGEGASSAKDRLKSISKHINLVD